MGIVEGRTGSTRLRPTLTWAMRATHAAAPGSRMPRPPFTSVHLGGGSVVTTAARVVAARCGAARRGGPPRSRLREELRTAVRWIRPHLQVEAAVVAPPPSRSRSGTFEVRANALSG
eukprot:scaffold1181_cov387-Prasinococcus_capsulatus_cf.AAC.7